MKAAHRAPTDDADRAVDKGATTGRDARLPDHEVIYRRMRELILFGELVPGQAVTIQSMQEATGAGMTPVREALRRLVAEGALNSGDNRRISVPTLTNSEIDEISFARAAIEPQLAALAAPRIGGLTIHALCEWDRKVDQAILNGDIHGYMRGNYHFHFTLYREANAEILSRIAMSLWLRIGPALRFVCGRYGTSGLPDRHRETIDALQARDADATARAIAADIRQGVDLIKDIIE